MDTHRAVTLALDLGTKCGFAILRADGRIESGTVSFQPGDKHAPGQRWIWFRRWLVDCKEKNPDLARVAFEQVVGHSISNQLQTAHVYGGFKALVEMFCAHHQFELIPLGVSTVKKQWAGAGNADKKQMIDRCRQLGFKPADDNEADAIAILHVACGTAPLLTPSLPAKRKKGQPKDPHPFYRTTGPEPF